MNLDRLLTLTGKNTLIDYATSANIRIGDMVRLDLGVDAGFPIGYVSEITAKSITLRANHPNHRPWNVEDQPTEYRVEDMKVFYGITKLDRKGD